LYDYLQYPISQSSTLSPETYKNFLFSLDERRIRQYFLKLFVLYSPYEKYQIIINKIDEILRNPLIDSDDKNKFRLLKYQLCAQRVQNRVLFDVICDRLSFIKNDPKFRYMLPSDFMIEENRKYIKTKLPELKYGSVDETTSSDDES
jgi:hypothetical protein